MKEMFAAMLNPSIVELLTGMKRKKTKLEEIEEEWRTFLENYKVEDVRKRIERLRRS
ncbi:MAG: hypothetical protein ABGW50_03725 [Thermococcus sp.]